MGRAGVRPVEAQLSQHPERPRARLGGRHAVVERPERHVLEQGGEKELVVGILEHQAYPTAQVAGRFGARDQSVHRHSTGVGEEQRVEMLEQRALARPGGAEQGDPLAGLNGEGDGLEGRRAVRVPEAELLYPDESRHHGLRHVITRCATMPRWP